MTRNLKATRGGPKAAPREVPKCPYHAEDMVYSPARLCWVCTHTGCAMVSWPKADVESGKPIIGRGDVELVKAGDMTFLRSGNILIDITTSLHKMSKDSGGGYQVVLYVENAIETDGYERKPLE